MVELGELAALMPQVGDTVTIDGKTLKFAPIQPKQVGPNGGIALNTGLRPPNAKITLLAFTVLDVPEKMTVKVGAGFTAATRIQLVLNGVPVKHKQVLDLAPGKYPLLVVLRMTANWDRIEPNFAGAAADDIAKAKEMQIAAEKFAAAAKTPRVLVRPASEVPEADRRKMFWVADKELADAWLRLHTREGF